MAGPPPSMSVAMWQCAIYNRLQPHFTSSDVGQEKKQNKKKEKTATKNNVQSSKIDENNTLHLLTEGRFDGKGFKVQLILT